MIKPEDLDLQLIFCDFVIKVENNLSDKDRYALIEYINIAAQTQMNDGMQIGQFGDDREKLPKALLPLYERVDEVLGETHKMLKLKETYKQKIKESWINTTKNSIISIPHQHPNRCLVVVYYPKENFDTKLTLNDVGRGLKHVLYDEHFIDEKDEITCDIYTGKPEEDLMVVFPAWLWHYVTQNQLNQDTSWNERMSVIFNSSIVENESSKT
jgi:hypothetical protein